MAYFRGEGIADVSKGVAQELNGWSGLPHDVKVSNTIRPQIWHAQRQGESRLENPFVQLDSPLPPVGR